MTQLQLVEIDARKEIEVRTIKAVSSSWSTLIGYCEDTFDKTPNDESDSKWDVRYTIEESKIIIVQEKISKYDK
jgi:hypothetical protein